MTGSPPDRSDAAPVGARDADGRTPLDEQGPSADAPQPERWRSPWTARRVVWAVVAAATLYYVVNVALVVSAARADESRRVDAIVVLGAAQYDGRPSPQLAARLDHAVELWQRGLADSVMVTGGKQPGDRFTEAEASQRYLVEAGVPEQAIMMENAGHNTFDSLEAAADILLGNGLEEVLLVTDPFHTKRSELIAAEVGLRAWSSPTPTSVVGGWTSARRQLLEAAGISVGRVIGFDRLSGLTG